MTAFLPDSVNLQQRMILPLLLVLALPRTMGILFLRSMFLRSKMAPRTVHILLLMPSLLPLVPGLRSIAMRGQTQGL